MTRTLALGIVLVGGFLVCSLGWMLLPWLQDAERTVEAEASAQLEYARRLLDRYSPGLAHKSLLIDKLRDLDVDVDLKDPDALTGEPAADEYQLSHEAAWAAYEPTDWRADPPRKAPRPTYHDLARQGRDAADAREDLLADNESLLDEALAVVNQALAVSKGDASGRTHAEANRLKGVVLYHMGLALRLRADIKRGEADPLRRRLVELSIRGARSLSSLNLVAESGIEERIAALQASAATADAKNNEDSDALAVLGRTIEDLEHRLDNARSAANKARKAMEVTKAAGVDFSDPNAAEAFEKRLVEQDGLYRQARRRAGALQFGTYPTARIDGSADYLAGRYVEDDSTKDVTIELGLTHYRDRRKVLAADVEARSQAADELRSDIAMLERTRAAYQEAQERAAIQIKELRAEADDVDADLDNPDVPTEKSAAEVFTDLNRVESEAFAIEERALERLDESVHRLGLAAGHAGRWVSDANARTRGLSPEARSRSAYSRRSDDGWMGGYIAAEVADARLARAWIFYRRFSGATETAEMLAKVDEPLQLAEGDAQNERIKAEEAHAAGVEEITEAVNELQRAHGEVGDHWTIVAQEAGALYLLALFGHESYVDEAIAAYRSALKGREDEPHVERLRARLAWLESR